MDYQFISIVSASFVILFILGIGLIWRRLRAYETLKYEFVTIIAHKFRTPLTKTKWILEGAMEAENDPYKKENLKNLNDSNTSLINLTNTLIELTDSAQGTLETYHYEREDMVEFVKKTVNGLTQRYHEQNLFLSFNFPSIPLFAKIDKRRMEFVLQTIMENSIHYSYTGRNVWITVTKEGHHVSISVMDEGIGIDKADKGRLLTKFFRAKNARAMDTEGFGIGLYLANSIIKRHSGKLKVTSKGINTGTTVTITLHLIK